MYVNNLYEFRFENQNTYKNLQIITEWMESQQHVSNYRHLIKMLYNIFLFSQNLEHIKLHADYGKCLKNYGYENRRTVENRGFSFEESFDAIKAAHFSKKKHLT